MAQAGCPPTHASLAGTESEALFPSKGKPSISCIKPARGNVSIVTEAARFTPSSIRSTGFVVGEEARSSLLITIEVELESMTAR